MRRSLVMSKVRYAQVESSSPDIEPGFERLPAKNNIVYKKIFQSKWLAVNVAFLAGALMASAAWKIGGMAHKNDLAFLSECLISIQDLEHN